MIEITTSGTMTERTLNQRSPINLPGIFLDFYNLLKFILHI